MNSISTLYSQPVGTIYSGTRRQRGAGILGKLFRSAIPVLRNVGKRVLSVGGRTIQKVVKGGELGQSLLDSTNEEFKNKSRKTMVKKPKKRKSSGVNHCSKMKYKKF